MTSETEVEEREADGKPDADKEPSPYEMIGGAEVLRKVVDHFWQRFNLLLEFRLLNLPMHVA